ncbi:hypothetical protein M231_03995 [Tremella mesenterica]|uniref:HpcH/HpaI aldolase/citrate lyase domain-containing protein n=1 Tax=Tremella mesenterica TaxID=5217 RepID=A0A4Q1BLL4_TREME|nr:hypothetical protein M231_03995 [Tremella mesenterica]
MTSKPTLKLRQKLQAGETTFGTFLMLPSLRTAQTVGGVGLDAVVVDCEHGAIGDSDMHVSVAAIASMGCSPIVRIRGPEGPLIKRALDTGAHGIMVPQINTAEEAASVVKLSKFPPLGLRGQGSPFSAAAHGLTTPEYLKSANDTLITMIQIETLEGLKNVKEIAAVPGVDMIFIGPNDLAFCLLGYTPANNEPKFVQAIDTIISAAREAGKLTGILVNTGEQAKEAKKKFDFVMIGGDVKSMVFWFGDQLKAARS